ncbi:MAG: hypothetical protein U1F66_07055 [bacterium]
MKKILILLAFFGVLGIGGMARAQCYGCNVYGYGAGLYYPYPWGWNYSTAAFAVDQAFATIQSTWTAWEQTQALENHIMVRRNNLENYKSIKEMTTVGVPAFAPVSPEGKPRSPKITWQDVESIGH